MLYRYMEPLGTPNPKQAQQRGRDCENLVAESDKAPKPLARRRLGV